jgi:hypothetical protein
MEEKRSAYKVLWGKLKERNNVEDLDVDGRIILKCIRKKQVGENRLDSSDARQG